MNISIIVPVKEDSVDLIRNKIFSIVPFNDNIEVIFVDAGCSDEVSKYIEFMSQSNIKRLLLPYSWRIEHNQPIAKNFGAVWALFNSDSKYLCFSDVDVIFSQDDLLKLYNIMVLDDADMVIGSFSFNGKPHPNWSTLMNFSLIKSSLFFRLGGFDTRFAGHYGFDDLEFLNRANKYGKTVHIETGAVMTRPDKGTFTDIDVSVNKKLYESLVAEKRETL